MTNPNPRTARVLWNLKTNKVARASVEVDPVQLVAVLNAAAVLVLNRGANGEET